MTSLAYAALWAFIFAVPWENTLVIPGLGTISRLLGMVALGCAVFSAVVNAKVRRLRLVHVSAMIFVILAGAGVFRSADSKWALVRFGTYLQLLLVVWMIWELANVSRRQLGLMLAYVLGAYVASLATILAYHRGGSGRRFAAAGFDPNDLGTVLALALPMAWYLGMTYRQPLLRWICRGFLPLGLVALGLTSSRGALVVGMVGLLIVPLTMTRLSPARMVGAMLLLIVCGGVAVRYIPEKSLERLSSTTTEVEEGTLNGRLRIWKAGLTAFAQKPLTGYGTASFKGTVNLMLGNGRVAHNTYLSVLVEQGLLGFTPWLMMFFAVFLQAVRLRGLERRFALVLLATLMTAMLPLTWDDKKAVWFVVGVLAAFCDTLAPRRAGRPRAQPFVRHPIMARPPVPPRARVGDLSAVPRTGGDAVR